MDLNEVFFKTYKKLVKGEVSRGECFNFLEGVVYAYEKKKWVMNAKYYRDILLELEDMYNDIPFNPGRNLTTRERYVFKNLKEEVVV